MGNPKAFAETLINQFPGRISSADPRDVPTGAAQDQENIQSLEQGRLTTRKGLTAYPHFNSNILAKSFASRYDTISVYHYTHPAGSYLIQVSDEGRILAMRNSAGTSIRTGVYDQQVWSFGRSRGQRLIGVNGLERGLSWDGTSTVSDLLGVDGPSAAPSVAVDTTGGSTAGDYLCFYRYVADSSDFPTYSNISPDLTVTSSVDSQRFTWTGFAQSTQARVRSIQLWRSTSDGTNTLYLIATLGHDGVVTKMEDSAGNVKITTQADHTMVANATFTVSGSRFSYDGTHEVTSVTDTRSFVTDAVWNANSKTVSASPGIVDNGSSLCRITFTASHNLEVNDVFSLAGSSEASYNVNHTVTAVGSTTEVDTSIAYVADDVTGGATSTMVSHVENVSTDTTWVIEGYDGDTATDDTLLANGIADGDTVMNILDGNGNAVARRFVPPPDYKCCLSWFQDRMFYAGDVIYSEGTITITAFSKTATVTGDAPPTTLAGRWLFVDGETEPLEIASISGNTITFVNDPQNSQVGATFYIRPPTNARNTVFFSEADEPESVPSVNVLTIQENAEDEDEIVGIHAFGAFLYILKERHIYAISFARQPNIDAQARLLTHRGAFNNRCWMPYEGSVYVMDQAGCYILSVDGSFQPTSEAIQDLWRDGGFGGDSGIDFRAKKWFFIQADFVRSLVYFFVKFADDPMGVYDSSGDMETSEGRPNGAIVYNTRTGAWWTEVYPHKMGGGAMVTDPAGGELVMVLGGDYTIVQRLFGTTANETDVVTSLSEATVSSATATTITVQENAGANFNLQFESGDDFLFESGDDFLFESESGSVGGASQDWIRAPLVVVDGDGKFQQAVIDSVDEGTDVLTLAEGVTLDPIPANGDTIYIGSVYWKYKTKELNLIDIDEGNKRSVQVDYEPTSDDTQFLIRRYWNSDTTPEDNKTPFDPGGKGVEVFADDPDVVVDMQRTLSSRGDRPGWSEFVIAGEHVDPRAQGRRKVAVQLHGFKKDQPVKINEVTVEGAQ